MTQSPAFGLPCVLLERYLNRWCSTPHEPRARATQVPRGTSATPACHHVQVANIAHQSRAPARQPSLYLSQSLSRVPPSPVAAAAILARSGFAAGLVTQVVGS